MESSDDSFIWTDASSNSEMALDAKTESESDSLATKELLQVKPSKKKSNKRKFEDIENSFNGEKIYSKIKTEPESDIDVAKKKKKRKNESSISKETGEIDDYLNIRVKQEQESFAETREKVSKKKRKHKKDNDLSSNDLEEQDSFHEKETEDYSNSKVGNNDNTPEDHIDDYLNFRVKQEEASFVEPSEKKPKKKKKSKKSSDTSDSYDLHLSESVMEKNDSVLNFENSVNNHDLITEKKDQFKKKKKKSKKNQDDHDVSNTDDNLYNSEHEMSQNNIKSSDDNTSGIIQNNCTDDNNDMTVDEDIINEDTHNESKNKTKNERIKKRESESSQCSDNDKEQNKQNKSMSERLRFEDEDTADYTLVQNTFCDNLPKQIRNFVKLRKNITHVPLDAQEDHFVSEEDDVWIIKCPNEFDVRDYVNVNLTLDSKCKIKLNGQTYDGALDDSIQRVPIVTMDHNKNKLLVKNVPVMGLMKFRKRIPKAHIPDQGMLPSYQNNFIPLPETKCRHPLFGANYKKAMKIPSGIAERLHRNNVSIQESLIDSCKPKKKKHKKEKFKIENDNSCDTKMVVAETPATSSKRKRKRKHSDEVDGPQHRSKRIKQELDSTDVWESEQAIENSLFGFE